MALFCAICAFFDPGSMTARVTKRKKRRRRNLGFFSSLEGMLPCFQSAVGQPPLPFCADLSAKGINPPSSPPTPLCASASRTSLRVGVRFFMLPGSGSLAGKTDAMNRAPTQWADTQVRPYKFTDHRRSAPRTSDPGPRTAPSGALPLTPARNRRGDEDEKWP
jgi:hypothetical protein